MPSDLPTVRNNDQCPAWEVFIRDESADRHEHSTSRVHAPDSELALINARDTYSRHFRPSSIWVAPAEAVCAIAPQTWPEGFQRFLELQGHQRAEAPWRLFVQPASGDPHRDQGLAQTSEIQGWVARLRKGEVHGLWVVAENRISRTSEEESGSLFDFDFNARKRRRPNYYKVPRGKRRPHERKK